MMPEAVFVCLFIQIAWNVGDPIPVRYWYFRKGETSDQINATS